MSLSVVCRILVVLLLPCLAQAQNYVDLANVYYGNTPQNAFKDSDTKTRVQETGFSLTYPQKLKNGNAIIFGVDGESISGSFTAAGGINNVGSITAKLGFNQNIGAKWSGTYVFLPKVASDFYGPLGSRDFQYGGLVVFKYIKRSDFKYKVGLYANSELFGPFFVPVLGVYYKSPNKKFEMDLSLPISGDINYRFTEKFFVGTRFLGLIKTYNLHQPYYNNKGQYLSKASNDLYAYLGYEFLKGLIVRGQVGYTFGRRYRIYDNNDTVSWGLSAAKFGDNRQQLNTDFKDGLLFRLDLIYRFYTN